VSEDILIPFAHREDCQHRFNEMRKTMGDLNGKTLIDIGCDKGYFMARFLKDGGKSAIGVEPLQEHLDSFKESGLNAVPDINQVSTDNKFDFCFYLDLHYHQGINYLPWCKENAVVTYASTSGDGNKNNQIFLAELGNYFNKIEFVTLTSWANREIYRCENVG